MMFLHASIKISDNLNMNIYNAADSNFLKMDLLKM